VPKVLGWRFPFIGGQERAQAVVKMRWKDQSYCGSGVWRFRPLRLVKLGLKGRGCNGQRLMGEGGNHAPTEGGGHGSQVGWES
jgi:hypothetical protein